MFYWNPAAPATQFFFNDRDPETHKIFTVLFDIATRGARPRVPLRRGAGRQQRRGAERRAVSRHQLRAAGPAARRDRLSRRARLHEGRAPPGRRWRPRGERAEREAHAARLVQAARGPDPADAAGRRPQGAVHQPHALEPRRQPRSTSTRAPTSTIRASASTCPSPSSPTGPALTMHAVHRRPSRVGIGAPRHRRRRAAAGRLRRRRAPHRVRRSARPSSFRSPAATSRCRPTGTLVRQRPQRRRPATTTPCCACADGTWARTPAMSRGTYTGGNLRIDTAPAWNRTSDRILFPAIDPADGTRQLFVIDIRQKGR